ncbi:MAG: hypothetical protein ACRCT8_16835 [Lacipirellulaceae bacterium]
MRPPTLETLELTLAAASDSAARLAVRMPPLAPGAVVRGSLRGPRSRCARTLPSGFALRTVSEADGWSGRFDVVEPCYWSPDLPMLYDLTVEVMDSESTVESHSVAVGLRRLAESGANLRLEGRRMVFRGWFGGMGEVDWEGLRRERLGLVGERFDDATRLEAAAWGVLLLETATSYSTPAEPAVLAAAGLVIVDAGDAAAVKRAIASGRPVVAVRRDPSAVDAASARRACERLQASLAPHTGLAGYVV